MIAKQPYIHNCLIESFKNNSSMTWDQAASSIGDYCSPSTIQRWFHAQVGEGRYCTQVSK